MAFKRKNVADLQQQLSALNKTANADYGPDIAEWKPTVDTQGNATAVIRFLDATEKTGHTIPFIKIYNHGFKEGNRWFIENCPTTPGIGHTCPVCAANGELWATEIDANKNLARDRKRKLSYWSNIYVVKDSKNPSSEGKVFKYRFGQKIMDKIDTKANPNVDLGLQPEDVTCAFEGSNFVLVQKRVPGQFPGQFFPNYDDSMFQSKSELLGGDEAKLEELEKELHDLSKIVAPSEFKSETELQAKLDQVLRVKSKPASTATPATATPAAATPAVVQQPAIENDNIDSELDDILGELGL